MGWIRVEDDFYDNPKIIAAGAHGVAVWMAATGWCNRNLTDGLIPRVRSRQLVDFTGLAIISIGLGGVDGDICADYAVSTLVNVGLFHEDGHDCPDCVQPGPRHYVIHDYLKYQPSRAEVEAKAEANRDRVRKFKERKNSVANALANAELMEQLHDTPNPNPNPSNTSLVTKEGEVALSNARDPITRPHCSKHPNGTDQPCRGCARVREWDEANAATVQADELEAKRRLREIADGCPDCHGTNVIEISDNEVIKCNHHLEEIHA